MSGKDKGAIPAWGDVVVGQWWRVADGREVKVCEKFDLSQQIRVRERGEKGEGDWWPTYYLAGATVIPARAVPTLAQAAGARRKGANATE